MNLNNKIAEQLNVSSNSVNAVVSLLDGGATIPFIARYRKELTGSLDEVVIGQIRDEIQRLRELEKRREAILKSIQEQGLLTPELEKKIKGALTNAVLEDLYLPYKPKRRTKATVAKEKGLEPLAKIIFEQKINNVSGKASKFINPEKEVTNEEEALQGARDIIAEWMSEDSQARESIRKLFNSKAILKSKIMKGKEEEGQKFKDYFEWDEPLAKAPSHRILAMRRGEKEMILSLDISPDQEEANSILKRLFLKGYGDCSEHVNLAAQDSYKRLIKPSIETETRVESKKRADEQAIQVFADNLKELLLAAPLGEKSVLAIDPGFRTGCKVVALDKQGKLLKTDVIYPHENNRQVAAEEIIKKLVKDHQIDAIAIGNGTAGRETEAFVRKISFENTPQIIMVNESGASIYSASEAAREEFPNEDITVRGAVSIGRRLTDPLAELVKIDAKSIGVGQYQHDVDQNALKKSLDDVVSSCVNAVGVEINTASKQLLTYVSGLGPQLAENIVKYREENGAFSSRKEILKVARMGDKVYEQAAGFLRIRNAKNPLDASAVHPESYHIVEAMAKDQSSDIQSLIQNKSIREGVDVKKYISDTVGLPTLKDILQELDKPGRDPRESFEVFSFQDGVDKISDLKIGMKLPGIVTNVTNFGAFVDIGVHQDGLVHISQLSNTFVSDPSQIVKVSQKVMVTVTEVDESRKRIALTMKDAAPQKSIAAKKASNSEKMQKVEKTKREEKSVEGDLQSKLSMLKGKWN